MNHIIEKANLSEFIVCDSAGTGGYHIGSPPDSRMTYAAKMRGIKLKGSARKFQEKDFNNLNVVNISSDLGFGVGTDDTTTGTTMVVDVDDDGTADSVLNLNDDPNFETFFDPFGNVVGNDDSFGAAAILGSGLSSNLNNLQQDVMNYNNQNNNQNTTQPQATNSNFAPFGEPGEYSYQTRMFNGTQYIWNRMMSGKWEKTFSTMGTTGNFPYGGGITF